MTSHLFLPLVSRGKCRTADFRHLREKMPAKPKSQTRRQKQSPSAFAAEHLQWLVDTGKKLKTTDGRTIEVWELKHAKDDAILSSWAKHFRQQYCSDNDIDLLIAGTNLSRASYLNTIKFPDASTAPGPSIRAGDFAEILVADYLEFRLNYWVPRTRYAEKTIRNESTKGCDIIGFKFVEKGKDPKQDALSIYESKAEFSGRGPSFRLQDAINDSTKDPTRKPESLNAIKQRFISQNRLKEAKKIERFQDPVARPYQEHYGAVAVITTPRVDESAIEQTNATNHPASAGLAILVIHGNDMMTLVHELYQRAADEA